VAVAKAKAMIDALRSISGVTAAGTVNRTPFTGGLHGIPIFRPGTTEFKLQNSVLAAYVFQMSPGYLEAAGTQLLRGRDISWHDTVVTPRVAIVNETFARKIWGETPPIGQHFLVSGNLTEVIGVAEDGKYHDLEESSQPVIYLALSQSAPGETVFVVRSQLSPPKMAAALERVLHGIEPNVPITVQNWSDALASELFPARIATVALGSLGLLAAMLAVTGIFGMAAYSVSKRMNELGIRVALGARKTHLLIAALGRPMVLLGLGSVLGLLAGFSTSRLLGQLVYQANPSDPAVIGGVVSTMALLGIAASALPVRRALTVDPSKLMREE
jgi:ABC-type antimicrobial peptide transport system permease subunit